MSRFYGQPIDVTSDAQGRPGRFLWQGREYVIYEILTTWHLRDRWWLRNRAPTAPRGASDRTYYRVRCRGEVYGEIYYDAISESWVLDRIYD